jgi:hypothetical protein
MPEIAELALELQTSAPIYSPERLKLVHGAWCALVARFI